MPDFQLFEYAVVRVVPRVEREEFINVGVVVYCRKQKFLKVLYHLNEEKVYILSPETDVQEIESHLNSFEKICLGLPTDNPISSLDPASRFRWLTATRSSVLQTSKVHPGMCADAEETLSKLFKQLVL